MRDAREKPTEGWVDPRQNPKPPAPPTPCEPAADPEKIAELLAFCRSGRIYEIERWIINGNPLQATHYDIPRKRFESPIEIAISAGLYDVALLLCNGYRLALEAAPPNTPLDQALQGRAWDIVDLLLDWRAEPQKVDPEAVLGAYRSDLMDRFWDAGLDFSRGKRSPGTYRNTAPIGRSMGG